jgi:uncharacterized protein
MDRARSVPSPVAPPLDSGVSIPLRATELGDAWSKLRLMAIHPDLLEILVCPVCKTEVQPVKDGAGLRCVQCKRVYPVKDDIPIMLEDEASIEG